MHFMHISTFLADVIFHYNNENQNLDTVLHLFWKSKQDNCYCTTANFVRLSRFEQVITDKAGLICGSRGSVPLNQICGRRSGRRLGVRKCWLRKTGLQYGKSWTCWSVTVITGEIIITSEFKFLSKAQRLLLSFFDWQSGVQGVIIMSISSKKKKSAWEIC